MDAEQQEQPAPGATGPELIELPSETQVVTTGPRRRTLVLGVAAAVVLAGAAAAVVVLGGDDEPDAEAALRAAQEVVEASESFRFEERHESTMSFGDPEGSGSDTTTRSVVTGTVAAPDRWHVVQDDGGAIGMTEPMTYETIRVGDELYSNGLSLFAGEGPDWVATTFGADAAADDVDAAEMAAEMWDQLGLDEDDPFLDEMRLELTVQSYLSDAFGDPAGITRVIAELSEPIVEEQRGDGGLVLRARLAPDPALAALGELPPVDAVIHLDPEGLPASVRFTAEAGSATADVQVAFSDWGAPLEVEAPPEPDVDRTPWVSEEGLAALDAALLLAPTAVPAPLELVGAAVYDEAAMFGEILGEDDAASSPCPSLSLTYGSETDPLAPFDPDVDFDDLEEWDYLDITVKDPSCAPDDGFLPVLEFEDRLAGHPANGGDGWWDVQFGAVVLSISTTFDDAAVEALVASVAPTTADALVGAIPGWVAEAPPLAGGYFAYPPMGFGGFVGG